MNADLIYENIASYHGCLSGDCPHDKADQCFKAIVKETIDLIQEGVDVKSYQRYWGQRRDCAMNGSMLFIYEDEEHAKKHGFDVELISTAAVDSILFTTAERYLKQDKEIENLRAAIAYARQSYGAACADGSGPGDAEFQMTLDAITLGRDPKEYIAETNKIFEEDK